MDGKTKACALVKELKETRDIKEVAKLLNSGDWIAICATTDENPLFSLGRVNTNNGKRTVKEINDDMRKQAGTAISAISEYRVLFVELLDTLHLL